MKEILMISSMYPFPQRCGFTVRLGDMCKHLSEIFQITLIVTDTSKLQTHSDIFKKVYFLPEKKRYQSLNKRLYHHFIPPYFDDPYYISDSFLHKLNSIFSRSNFDICMIHTPKFARVLKNLPNNIFKVIDTHDIWYHKYKEFDKIGYGKLLSHFRNEKKELRLYRNMDLVIGISLFDYEYLKGNGISNCVYAPVSFLANPIYDPKRFDHSILYPAGRGPNNEDAIHFFITKILPRVRREAPSVKFKILNPSDKLKTQYKSTPNVEFLPFQNRISDAYKQADIVVIPLRVKSGLKIKLLESFAFAMPVILSSETSQGVCLKDYPQKGYSLYDSSFTNELIKALKSEEYRKNLSIKGLEIIKRHYSAEKVYSELIKKLNKSPGGQK